MNIKEFFINNETILLGIFSGCGITLLLIMGKVIQVIINSKRKYNKEKKENFPDLYHQVLCTDKYIEFQNKLLKKYYSEGNKSYTTDVFGETYCAYFVEADNSIRRFPFDKLNSNLFIPSNMGKEEYNEKAQKEYRKIIETKKPRYKVKGYMLEKFELNKSNKIKAMSAYVGTYEDNLFTSHILEYELYKTFKKYKNYNLDCEYDYKKIVSGLKYRNAIHNGKSIKEVLLSGCNRASLLGVQLLILFKTDNEKYKTIYIKRSSEVASRPGYHQFVPSGGFEIYGVQEENLDAVIRENYSVEKAIFRELLEEIFGMEEFDVGRGNEDLRRLEENQILIQIKNLIDNKKAFFEFLGSTIDLVGLRNELSFVLRIDDVIFSKNKFEKNIEGIKIDCIDIEKVNEYFGLNQRWNPTSATLWKMCTNNHLYKEIVDDK